VPINVSIQKTKTKEWVGLELGKTEVLMVVPDNRVQYVINLQNVGEDNFSYNAETKRVRFQTAPPELDKEMVSLQSDPAQYKIMTDNDGFSTNISSGEKLRNAARAELHSAVIAEGSKSFLREQARQSAELHLRKLLSPMLRSMDPDVELEIEFRQRSAE
jgi:hypothetical protein